MTVAAVVTMGAMGAGTTEMATGKVYKGKNKNFLVLSRRLAKSVTGDEPYSVISITDPNKISCRLAPSRKIQGVLRIQFDDVERPEPGYTECSLGSLF